MKKNGGGGSKGWGVGGVYGVSTRLDGSGGMALRNPGLRCHVACSPALSDLRTKNTKSALPSLLLAKDAMQSSTVSNSAAFVPGHCLPQYVSSARAPLNLPGPVFGSFWPISGRA